MTVDGYIIVQPFRGYEVPFIPVNYSFGKTESEAWRRFIGPEHDEVNIPTIIQRWHDKGWRVKKAS